MKEMLKWHGFLDDVVEEINKSRGDHASRFRVIEKHHFPYFRSQWVDVALAVDAAPVCGVSWARRSGREVITRRVLGQAFRTRDD